MYSFFAFSVAPGEDDEEDDNEDEGMQDDGKETKTRPLLSDARIRGLPAAVFEQRLGRNEPNYHAPRLSLGRCH